MKHDIFITNIGLKIARNIMSTVLTCDCWHIDVNCPSKTHKCLCTSIALKCLILIRKMNSPLDRSVTFNLKKIKITTMGAKPVDYLSWTMKIKIELFLLMFMGWNIEQYCRVQMLN